MNIVQILPPRVKITSPAKSGTKVDEEELEVSATAESTGKYPVTAMRLLLDGRPFQGLKGVKRFEATEPGTVKASWQVPLTTGRHRLMVLADSAVSQGNSETVEVSYVVDSPPPQGRLFVLAIGIAAYKDPNLKLYFGASDARAVVQRLKEKSTPFPYQKVEPWILADRKATRSAILEGFAWLQKEMKPNDSVCVFYSGHGERGPNGGLYLLPADVDLKELEKTGISGEQLKAALVGLPGQVLLILDACHAGAVGRGKPLSNPVTNDLAKELGRDENGILVMCSSKSRQVLDREQRKPTQLLHPGAAGRTDRQGVHGGQRWDRLPASPQHLRHRTGPGAFQESPGADPEFPAGCAAFPADQAMSQFNRPILPRPRHPVWSWCRRTLACG